MRENTSELSPEARAHYEEKARGILSKMRDSGYPYIGRSDARGSATGIRGYDDIHGPEEGEPMISVRDEQDALDFIIKSLIQKETGEQEPGGSGK